MSLASEHLLLSYTVELRHVHLYCNFVRWRSCNSKACMATSCLSMTHQLTSASELWMHQGYDLARTLAVVEDFGLCAGRYELMAVLTHKGRSADSGHYVSWVKQDSGQWVQFDDEQLVLRKEDEIATLAGGGDWHMAYLLMYRAQQVPKT